MKAMIFAAGLGTRLQPFTLTNPKALALVNGKTLLERNIRYLQHYGIDEIVINVHHFADKIIDFLEENRNFGAHIQVSDETDEVLETGGGLVKAQSYFDAPFLVMNVDILTDLNVTEFIRFHQTHQPLVSLAVSERESSRKLLFDDDMKLTGWQNLSTGETQLIPHSTYKPFAFSGIHLIHPKLFSFMPTQGKFSIMTTYMELMKTQKILGFNHTGSHLIDVGKPESIKEAESVFH